MSAWGYLIEHRTCAWRGCVCMCGFVRIRDKTIHKERDKRNKKASGSHNAGGQQLNSSLFF